MGARLIMPEDRVERNAKVAAQSAGAWNSFEPPQSRKIRLVFFQVVDGTRNRN
jgi:hypothetical protein